MNRERRKTLYKAAEIVKELKGMNDPKLAFDKIEIAIELVEDAKDEEQWAFDALPEGLQMSSRGEDMEDNVADLEDAICDLEIVRDTIEEMDKYDYTQLQKDILSALDSISNATLR